MKKLLWLLGTLITSLAMGVSMIQPQEKVFTPGQYYVGQQENTPPDWRGIYLNHVGGPHAAKQVSDKSIKRLDASETTFIPTTVSNFQWFWSVPRTDIKKSGTQNDIEVKYLSKDKDGKDVVLTASLIANINKPDGFLATKLLTFEIAKGTKLIAPANSYLVPGSANSDGVYPDTDQTRGKFMQVIVKQDNVAYRVTYDSMLMWWSDMSKTEPDDYKDGKPDEPIYYHSLAFSEKDIFDAGSIIGVAGNSGMPIEVRKQDTSFVTITVEKSSIDQGIVTGEWYPMNIEDFFQIGGVTP